MSSGETITQYARAQLDELEAHPGVFELLTSPQELDTEMSVWRVERRVTRIGSSTTCDLTLRHPTVSRDHARVELDRIGYRLIDAESKNGVWINKVRVRDAYLEDGDLIQIGHIRLRFKLARQEVSLFPLWRGDSFGALYGASTTMRELFALLDRVSQSEASVLIQGESGTGKELAARAIHDRSNRSGEPLITFDCSATPSALIESELFGHIRGAFTGALEGRQGAFSAAEGGSLFLDEIGELPLELQPKLLRALERQEVKRLGEDHYRSINVRILSATHRDLSEAVRAGRFRADLYYRLAVLQVSLPPLRDHLEDLPGLVERLIETYSPSGPREVSFKTMELMLRHRWPGNVRELKNYVQRAIALSAPEASRLDTRFLVPEELAGSPKTQRERRDQIDDSPNRLDQDVTAPQRDPQMGATSASSTSSLTLAVEIDIQRPFKEIKGELVERFERRYWSALLEAHGGNVSAAARVAGIHRKSAEYLLKKLELNARDLSSPLKRDGHSEAPDQ